MSAQPDKVDERQEYERFLDEHPEARVIDAITIDLCGIVRGKRYPRGDLENLYTAGLAIPYTVYLLDVTGDSSDPCGRGFTDGDPDGILVPVPGSLVSVPWADEPRGQVLMTMTEPGGTPSMIDPRNVAAHVLERFEALGLRPVLAFELEFYLLDKECDAQGLPQPPVSPVTGKRESSTQVYGINELDGFAAFFQEVGRAGQIQNVPASIATSEFAPGQYEINLRHVDEPLTGADHCSLLRNIVQRVAKRHEMEASFMAKPFPELTGNGMHVHLSLLDGDGRNVFDDGSELGSETLRHAVAGMMETMSQAMAIYAPNVNAFRRFGPNLYVPVSRSWGTNNRSVAFRIPVGEGRNRRIEHRMASADANPYLVLAAILAGAHHGIANKLDPGPDSSTNACDEVDPDLPLSWLAALDRMQGSELMVDYLTKEYVDLYCETKRGELRRFEDHISPREYEWYL